jgi:transcriptional regulator with XRE-family HTH domain
MKNKKNWSTQLGIPQRTLALLLNVNRSQLAMFECGDRLLSHEALQKLQELCNALQTNKKRTTAQLLTPEEQAQYHHKLKKLLDDTDFQQKGLLRAIEALEKKVAKHTNTQQLLHHLDQQVTTKTPQETHALNLIQRGVKASQKYVTELLEHQLQLKLLQAQAQVLREELGE